MLAFAQKKRSPNAPFWFSAPDNWPFSRAGAGTRVFIDRIRDTAKTDPKKAHLLARSLTTSPWSRCIALAWAAHYAADNDFNDILNESIKAAFEADDPYQCVGACAWPLHAMAERKRHSRASVILPKLLSVAARISNPVSRGDGLMLLWQAAYPMKPIAEQVLPALVAACHAMNSWKGPYNLRAVSLMLAATDSGAARTVIADMREGRLKRQAQRCLAAGSYQTPRSFFPE